MKKLGLAVCGSFCTFDELLPQVRRLAQEYEITPILSEKAYATDTRFGLAAAFVRELRSLCAREPLLTIEEAEALGPGTPLDVLAVAPCTGNTLAKLAAGIADGPVTFACKAHLRNQRPVVVAVSTNDGLAAAAQNIGALLNRRNYYFVPFGQDDPIAKPGSLKADLGLLGETLAAALEGRQLQPVLLR
jgi:dipicolinate synthase subunit B